jgi:hypothetical protein
MASALFKPLINQKLQQTIRNINGSRPFLDTDDFDTVDASDVLPFPQLLPTLKPTSGGDTRTAREPRGRRRPLGSKNKNKRQHVAQSQSFRFSHHAN